MAELVVAAGGAPMVDMAAPIGDAGCMGALGDALGGAQDDAAGP